MQRRRPDDFVPPYPAFTSHFPSNQPEFVMAQVAVQSAPSVNGEALAARVRDLMRVPGAGRPQHVERSRHQDQAGYTNDVALGDWKCTDDMQAFRERADVRALLDDPSSGPVGRWRECISVPNGSLDRNYSVPEA